MTLDDYFEGWAESRRLFEILARMIQDLGPSELKVTRSQVSFRSKHPFAWAWVPEKYLRRPAAPLVLTLSFRRRDPSPRWKQVVEAAPGRFTHHLELNDDADLDEEVRAWLRAARRAAG